jgi:tRNA 2-thiouridine synthesizing protein C
MTDLMVIFSQRPHSSIHAQEALDAALAGTAFAEVSLLFLGDGVLQLLYEPIDATPQHRKAFQRGFAALTDYEITNIACCADAFNRFRLPEQKLIIQPTLLIPSDISHRITHSRQILSF